MDQKFQSTSPVWGMTPSREKQYRKYVVSIHIPRVGDDRYDDRWEDEDREVSIHIPRVGDDTF